MLEGNLSSLLIVESEDGQVYFVEDEERTSKLDEIRKGKEKKNKKSENFIKYTEFVENEIKQEFKEEPQSNSTLNYINSSYDNYVPFIEVKQEQEYINDESDASIHYENEEYLEDDSFEEPTTSKTEIQSWNDDTDEEEEKVDVKKEKFEFSIKKINKKSEIPRRLRAKIFRDNLTEAEKLAGGVAFGKHKMRKLVGVPACRYCDTIFVDRRERDAHDCKYLQCDPRNFICRICGKELSKKTFSNHVHEAAECQYCGKKVLNPRQMKKHIAAKHKEEDFKPPIKRKEEEIERYIKEKQEQEAHIHRIREQRRAEEEVYRLHYLHHYRKNPRYQCDICGRREPSKREITNHINMHLDIPLAVCPKCGLKIFTSEKLRKHACTMEERKRAFTGPNQKYCRFCGVTFDTAELNRTHTCEFLNPDDPKHVTCRFCSKRVAKSDFGHHMERHKDSPNECHICKQTFMYKRGLKMHMKIHTGENLYKCELCATTFQYKQNYDHHIKTHGISGGKNIPCEYCGKNYSTDVTLKKHQARVHELGIKCETCKAPLESKEAMLQHMSLVHGPVMCQHCPASFLEPKKLKIHERRHFEPDMSNRLNCDFCMKSFLESRMRRHVYKEHQEQFESWSAAHPAII